MLFTARANLSRTIPILITVASWLFLVIIGSTAIILAGIIPDTSHVLAESWYPGEGLKQGDYFRYDVCWTDHNNCAPFEIDFWVKSKTLDGSGWNLEFAAIDGSITQKGSITIGMITPDPMNPDPNVSDYANVYKNTISWLDACATSESPKDFSLPAWCRNGGVGGQPVSPEGQDDVTVQAVTFKAWKLGWHKGVDSTIWVVPSLPFPVKAQVYADVANPPIPLQYYFELLQTGNNSTEPQFMKKIGQAPPPPQINCVSPNMQMDSVHNSHNTDTGNMIIEYRYSPSIPKQGCPVELRLSFEKNFDLTQKYSNVYYDILTVNDAGNKLASEAQNLGRQYLFAPVGDDDRTLTIKQPPPVTHYVIYISGVDTAGGNFDTSTSGLVKIDIHTTSIPEFGTIVTWVLAAALISIIMISARTSLRLKI